jgi:3-deoxy-D-manno-octulosonic-acid transferase
VAVYLFFYHIFLLIFRAGVNIAALQNQKAKLWLQGRRNWQENLKRNIQENFSAGKPTVWMHCASLGEFEQGRPLFEQLKEQSSDTNFLVTFFSPSGYEVCKNYSGANVVCYLPIDSAANAKAFVQLVQPTLVLWIKYEYWFYYLNEIKTQHIPLLLISGIFRPGQPFFKWYGKLHRKMLQCFTHLFVQNETSESLATTIVEKQSITVSGDTRFDRVITVAEKFEPILLIEGWLTNAKQVMVCGSTWDEDEEELSHYIRQHAEIKFIIAPHNINKEHISDILKLLPDAILYTQLIQQKEVANSHVLIVDTIGILSRLYKYAHITFVGGGFGSDGVHNVLEAAVYGKPVVHGPEFEKYAEATGLVEAGGAFEVEDALHLEKLLDKLFTKEEFYNNAAAMAKAYVYKHKGASNSIIQFIQENRLLTSQ